MHTDLHVAPPLRPHCSSSDSILELARCDKTRSNMCVVSLKSWSSFLLTVCKLEDNYPLSWSPAEREQVIMHFIHNSLHYPFGSSAWDNLLLPHEDAHLVHVKNVGGSVSTQTVALFHQLRCIEILHKAYVEEGSHRTSDLAQHCLNYVRQTVMCQLDMTNEPQAGAQTSNGRESLCRDWESVYREAERNQEAHRRSLASL